MEEHPDRSEPHDYLRRLSAASYRGWAIVHWSMAVADRRTGWLDDRSHAIWRETLLHTLARYQLASPMYCLMPDHAHLLLVSLTPDGDQRRAVSFFRRYSQRIFRNVEGSWQKQAYDHVLRNRERGLGTDGFSAIAYYISENPVRGGLVEDGRTWPYSGSLIVGWPDLEWRQAGFWERWWMIYHNAAERA